MLEKGSALAVFPMLFQKGFIGPIGDDIPSLIPLLLGLVIFFSTFTSTLATFDQRNSDFSYDLTTMTISRIMQSNSYITGLEEFKQHCNEIGNVPMSFVVVVSDSELSPNANIFEVKIFENSDGKFYCSNVDSSIVSNPEYVSNFISADEASDRKVVSRIFPIAVEDAKIVKPKHLFVVAWK